MKHTFEWRESCWLLGLRGGDNTAQKRKTYTLGEPRLFDCFTWGPIVVLFGLRPARDLLLLSDLYRTIHTLYFHTERFNEPKTDTFCVLAIQVFRNRIAAAISVERQRREPLNKSVLLEGEELFLLCKKVWRSVFLFVMLGASLPAFQQLV